MELIKKGTKLLCLSPHPDDVEFGLGGTLTRFRGVFEGQLVVFSDRKQTRGESHNERSQNEAGMHLGFRTDDILFIDQLGLNVEKLPIRFFATEENRDVIRMVVTALMERFQPDVVFVPCRNETMQDHVAMAEEVIRVVRGEAAILGYEVPKHNRYFKPDMFVRLTDEDLDNKIAALNCFDEFTNRYYFHEEAIRALATVRALDAGYFGSAEGFEIYRLFVS